MYSIYVVHNSINDMKYVGYTSNVKRRMNAHRAPSTHKRCPYNKMYSDMDLYGRDNFWYEVVASASTETEARELEALYIAKYDAFNKGYNSTEYGSANCGENNGRFGDHNNYNERKVICVNTGVIYDSIRNAEKDTGVSNQQISKICKGELFSGYNLVFKYLEEYDSNKREEYLCKPLDPRCKAVIILEDGRIYKSAGIIAKELGLKSQASITLACNDQSRTAGGYHVMWLKDYLEQNKEK